MSEFTVKDIFRASHTKRWGIVRTIKQQTLADHGYNVTMISMILFEKIIPDTGYDIENERSINKLKTMEWALYHDLPELVYNDLPSPVKQFVAKRCGNVFDEMEKGLSENFDKHKMAVTNTPFKVIVKIADIIDGIVFLNSEGMGKHSDTVENKLLNYFDQLIIEAKEKHHTCDWGQAYVVLDEALNGEDTILGFEFNGGL